MKATKKLNLKIVICLAVLLLGTVIFAACNNNQELKYDYLVTFNYNTENVRDQYLGVMKNSLVGIRPGYNEFEESVINGYIVDGWYLAADEDNDGVPDKDDKGKVILGREWDFAHDRVNEDMTLYAKLEHSPVIYFIAIDIDMGKENEPISDAQAAEAKNKVDAIISLGAAGVIGMDDAAKESYGIAGKPRYCRPGDRVRKPTTPSLLPSKRNYTWMQKFYSDPKCENEFVWGENGNGITLGTDDVFIYAKFVKGTWELVSTAEEFNKSIGNNIYLLNDIDFSDVTYLTSDVMNYELAGNNHSLKNITVKQSISKSETNLNFGLFRQLGAYAYIHDLTFENITIEFNVTFGRIGTNFGFFTGYAASGAQLEHIRIINGKYSVNLNEYAQYVTTSDWIAENHMENGAETDVDHSDVTLVQKI